jgi:hypothetical protein
MRTLWVGIRGDTIDWTKMSMSAQRFLAKLNAGQRFTHHWGDSRLLLRAFMAVHQPHETFGYGIIVARESCDAYPPRSVPRLPHTPRGGKKLLRLMRGVDAALASHGLEIGVTTHACYYLDDIVRERD